MNKMFLYFGFAMAVVYLMAGIYLMFGRNIFDLPEWVRKITGGVLIVYAVFRFFRYRSMAKQEQ